MCPKPLTKDDQKMRWKKRACLGIVLAALAATSGYLAKGQDAGDGGSKEQKRAADLRLLEGLPGVYVVVEYTEKPLDRERLGTAIASRLGKAGVRVLEKQELLATKAGPYLYVNVNTKLHSQTGLYAIAVDVSLIELASPVRKPSTVLPATTWSRADLGLVDREKLIDGATQSVLDKVDDFANLYLAANSSKDSTTKPSK
jgi:hypothetical protein